MDDLIQLLRVIPATRIAEKWRVTEDRLNEIVGRYKLPLYTIREKRIRPDDRRTVFFCSVPRFQFYYEGQFGYGGYILKDEYFDADNIEEFEFAHPEILWVPACPDNDIEEEYGEYIPADVIRRRLNMSPMQFVDLMNSGQGPVSSWEKGFRAHRENIYSNGDFFSTEDLQYENFTFHVLDWLTWQEARTGEGSATASAVQSAAGKGEDTASALREKDARIAELEKELATASQPQEVVTVDAALWENSFRAACSVLVEIVGNDEMGITRTALENRMKDAASGGRTHTKADRIAWESLPDKHKSGPGRPKKIAP